MLTVSEMIVEELAALEASRSPSFQAMMGASKHLSSVMSLDASGVTVRQLEAVLVGITSESTRGKVRMLLTRAFGRAVADGKLDRNTAQAIPKIGRKGGRDPRAAEPEVLTIPEQRSLLHHAGKHKDLWALLLGTGMRLGEALAVDRHALDQPIPGIWRIVVCAQRHRDWNEVRETKTSSVREVAVGAWVIDALGELPIKGSDSTLWAAWQKDLARAGLRERRVHATRHTFISTLASLGIQPEVIREMTHPKGGDAFSGYLHRGFGPKAEAAKALERALR